MSSLGNNYDAIESLIFENGLKIKGVHFYPEMDMMLVVLNNQKIIKYSLSSSKLLSKATPIQVTNYQLIGKGSGIHWPELDEDLSLKGLLQQELINQSSQLTG